MGEKRKQENKESGEYRFVKEIRKSQPVDKRGILKRIAAIAAAAVLFGVISSFIIAVLYPVMAQQFGGRRNEEKVDIDVNEPEEIPEDAAEETTKKTKKSQEKQETEVVEVPREITLQDYEKIYEEVRQIADESLKAVVTVAGLDRAEDVLSNSYVSFDSVSGVIIGEDSNQIYLLIDGAALGVEPDHVQVTFCDGKIAKGKLKMMDAATMLAVIAVPLRNIKKETRENIAVAELGNSYSLMQGKPVIAIGSPSGYNESVAYGNILSVSTKVSVVDAEYNLLVTDILGSTEGSGVLLDTNGSVIGIISQSFGDPLDTMVKALSVAQLKTLLAALTNGDEIRYAGIYGQDVTESIAEISDIPQGIYVDSVETESPAMVAGIQIADIITEFNGKEVKTMRKFFTELQKCKNDERVSITLMRKGNEGYEEMKFTIIIG